MAFVHEFLFELIRQRHSRGLIVVSLATVALVVETPIVSLVPVVVSSFHVIQLNHQPNLVHSQEYHSNYF